MQLLAVLALSLVRKRTRVIATFDLETYPIDRGQLAPRIVCMSYRVDRGQTQLCLRAYALMLLRAWLSDPAAVFVGANIAYDFACIAAVSGEFRALVRDTYAARRVRDVQLNAKLLDIAAGRYEHAQTVGGGWSLDALARRRGGRELNKDKHAWRLRFKALDGVPIEHWPPGARDYACDDAAETDDIDVEHLAAGAEWAAAGYPSPIAGHGEAAAAKAYYLHRGSCWGVLTDPERVANLEARAGAYRAKCARRLQRAGLVREGRDDGKRDTKAAARAMVDRCRRLGREPQRTVPDNKGKGGYENALATWHEKWNARATDSKGKLRTPRALAQREKKLRTWWHGDTFLGGVQLDKDQCILSGSHVLELYAEYTGTGTLWSRVENMRNGFELPLQTRFDPVKETLRTSSTQPGDDSPLKGEQMQNFPRASGVTPTEKRAERGFIDKAGVKHEPEFFVGLRECFKPRDGNVFVVADYSMAELHTLAQLCIRLFGYSKLAELLNAKIDVHWYFAAQTLGLTIDEVKKLPDAKRHRDRAKPLNFGIPGGMGPDRIILYSRKGYGVRFERDEVVRNRTLWLDTFPEVRQMFDWVSWQLKRGGQDREFATFTHVHPITGFIRGGCRYTSGANHGFQHLCAYGAGNAVAAVGIACETPKSPLFGFCMVNFVHDEIILEGQLERAAAAALELQRIMEAEFNRYVPDVPTHAEPFITSIWSKQAKAVHNAAGELIEWFPKQKTA